MYPTNIIVTKNILKAAKEKIRLLQKIIIASSAQTKENPGKR